MFTRAAETKKVSAADQSATEAGLGAGTGGSGRNPAMKYGLSFKTAGSAGQIGDLLELHCRGKWHIVLCDVETVKYGVKELKIMFELEADKNTFKAVVSGKK